MTTDPGSGTPASGPPAAGPPVSGPPPTSSDAGASERLQAMLAQASQGQREEQREITNSLTEVRNQLLRLGQEIAELRATPATEPGDGAAINTVTVELREAVRFLSDRLDGVTRLVAQRGEELADIRTGLSAIDAHVRSQAETIGVLSTGLQALPSYGERVSGLQEHIDAVHQRLAGLETAVSRPATDSGVNNRLAAIEASLGPLGQQVAGATRAAADHNAALAQTSASLQGLHGKLEEIAAGTQAALATPASFDDSALTALDQRLAAVAADLRALSEQVSGLAAPPAVAGDEGITEDDLERAMRASEERMRSHIDDAVIALAEALLRPRTAAGPASSVSTSPSVAPPPAAAGEHMDVPSVAQPVAEDPGSDASAAIADDGDDEVADDDEDLLEETAAVPDRPSSKHWWEREEFAPPSPGQGSPAIPSLDDDLSGPEAAAIDFSRAEMTDEDGDEEAAAHPDVPPAEASDAANAEDADPQAGPVGEAPPVHLPPPPLSAGESAPDDTDPLADTASWSPEVPGARPEATETDSATIIPERKGRLFGRKK